MNLLFSEASNNETKFPNTPSDLTLPISRKSRKRIYAIGLIAVVVIAAASAVLTLQGESALPEMERDLSGSDTTMQLSLNYQLGEHMVYKTTNSVTNNLINGSLPDSTNNQSYNSTTTIDVTSTTTNGYTTKQKTVYPPDLLGDLPTLTLNVTKSSYYNSFLAPGAPLIFYNATNPTILAYLAQSTVNVGDVWKIPVNTGNSSLGLTGEVTLTFAGIENITVPSGTYRVMRIEATSNNLVLHSDGSILHTTEGMTTKLSGTSYVEQATCRLIKADLTQISTTNTPGIGSTSTIYTEKILIEHIS